MRATSLTILLAGWVGFAGGALAQETEMLTGNAAAGETKAAVCVACHGQDGNSLNGEWPKLAGQHEHYTVRQLKLYKSGERENAIMTGMAVGLSDQDMADIGAYYAQQVTAPGIAEEEMVAHGAKVFRVGYGASAVPACQACHGPTGLGNPLSGYPRLAGQHADYTAAMLRQFKDGAIWGADDDANAVMAEVAEGLTDADIEAVSTFIEGLYPVTSE